MQEPPGAEELYRRLMDRITYENELLNTRTGHVLTVHGFLATAAAITYSNNKLCPALLISGFAFILSLFHIFVGAETLHSITYWDHLLAPLEEKLQIPAAHRFDANLHGESFFSRRFTHLVNRSVAVLLPSGLLVFWSLMCTIIALGK
jgi:hypothetical protein